MTKYRQTFDFVNTEAEAINRVIAENTTGTRYKRKNHPAHYTPWNSRNKTENKFIVWYYI